MAAQHQPLILLKDDSSSGQLPAQGGDGSSQGESWAAGAETWLLQDLCDIGWSLVAMLVQYSLVCCLPVSSWWCVLWLHGQHGGSHHR